MIPYLVMVGIVMVMLTDTFEIGGRSRGWLPPDAELVLKIAEGVLFACSILALAGCLAWVWSGRERWIIRQNSLVIRRDFLGRTWRKNYSGSELFLLPEEEWSYLGRSRSWKLRTTGHGTNQAIATTPFLGVQHLLELGNYLARRTGWRWHPPSDISLSGSLIGYLRR